MAKYLTITHNSSEVASIEDLFKNRSVNLIVGISQKDFLNYKGLPEGASNFDRILRKHTSSEDKKRNQDFYDSGNYGSVEILVGTQFQIPAQNLEREVLFSLDDNVVNTTTSKAFISEQLAALMRDPTYSQIYDIGEDGSAKVINTDITVFMWSKALSSDSENEELGGGWIDVTPYIQSVTTKVEKDLGQFSLSVAPIIGKQDSSKGWIIDPDLILREQDTFTAFANVRKDSISKKESNFFFHQIAQENDLVYIRFEQLEKDKRKNNVENSSSVAGNTYDMIGLVDRSFLSTNFENNDFSVMIQGRDLMKVFIEDGSYFFPLQFATNVFAQNGSKLIGQRSLVDGKLLTLSAYLERSILFTLQFIISQLSTSGFVPDNVFSERGYTRDQLSKTFLMPGGEDLAAERVKNAKRGSLKESLQPGIWQIIKLLVDPSVARRRIVDSSIAQEQGSMINSIRKICQEPFVEFFGDTYGDKYVFQARKPPFDQKGAFGLIYDDVEEKNGDLINGSQSDISGIRVSESSIDSSNKKAERLSDLTLDIEDIDLFRKDLYYDTEVYSWYHLRPSGLLFGEANKLTTAYVPAVSFDEYTKIYGSRVFSKEHNYVPYNSTQDKNASKKDSFLLRQTIEDLRFMIQSSQHLPFTRKGTIVVSGNRTYKRGMFVRLKSTNEIFYVDAVENTWQINGNQIDRATTLFVSRGMVEPYIRGVDKTIGGKIVNVSYFNIIDTTIPSSPIVDTEFLKNWKVNTEVFTFFLKRNQWK